MSKKYEYIVVKLKFGWSEPDYQKTIQEYAENGWRLVQIFAYPTAILQQVTKFTLIFERKIQ